MGSDKEVLAALDFPIPCTVCRHPATGHVGDILKCGECDCSRSNPGGYVIVRPPDDPGATSTDRTIYRKRSKDGESHIPRKPNLQDVRAARHPV